MSWDSQTRREREPCPNCDKPEGAVMGTDRWGHRFHCCSETCGLAFANTSKRWLLEYEDSVEKLRAATEHTRRTHRELQAARTREGKR